jgi:Tfp pilus assembly protein PilX
MNSKTKSQKEKGAAMLIVVIFFMMISLTIVIGIANPILKQVKISKDLIRSNESFYLSEGALDDAVYRLKTNKSILSGDTLTLNGHTATVNLTTTMNGKTVETTSSVGGVVRKMQSSVIVGSGASFNYGIQSGTGGFVLSGGSRVNGNVYANGDIIATNGVVITGTAIAANSAALSADQANDSPSTPPNTVNFRNSSATQDLAQSFQLSAASPINKASFYIKKVGNPPDISVRIVTDSSGLPSSNDVFTTQGTLLASSISSSNFAWVDVVFPENPELLVGTTYWIILDNGSQNSSNYYEVGANSAYSGGQVMLGKYSGSWNNTSPAGLDSYFRIYLGGVTSTIGGGSSSGGVIIGSGGIRDAWAHEVKGASVAGHLYCKTGSDNNQPCDTSRNDPSPQPMPVSEANVLDWKSEASAGGVYNGNYSVGSSGATAGPLKINGNLSVSGGGTLTLSGTVWVTGNISVSGGGKIKLASSYGSRSGVLLSDGIVNLSGGGVLTGSGTAGSYLLILTTSDCPLDLSCGGSNALNISGGAGAVVLSAQNGVMSLSGGMNANAATARQITATGGTTIDYQSGLADMNFSSGPSGGWDISSWGEVP